MSFSPGANEEKPPGLFCSRCFVVRRQRRRSQKSSSRKPVRSAFDFRKCGASNSAGNSATSKLPTDRSASNSASSETNSCKPRRNMNRAVKWRKRRESACATCTSPHGLARLRSRIRLLNECARFRRTNLKRRHLRSQPSRVEARRKAFAFTDSEPRADDGARDDDHSHVWPPLRRRAREIDESGTVPDVADYSSFDSTLSTPFAQQTPRFEALMKSKKCSASGLHSADLRASAIPSETFSPERKTYLNARTDSPYARP